MAAGLYVPDPFARRDITQPDVYARVPGVPPMPGGASGLADLARYRPPFPMNEPAPTRPGIYANPTTQQWSVGGMQFGADDDQAALESEAMMGRPDTGPPPGGGWEAVDPQAYAQYLEQIKNPTLGRLAKRNFGRGVDIQQQLLGRGLQFFGAEQTGQRLVDQQTEDLRKTSPYERQFTDIGSADNQGPIDWLVANFAQQGPNLIESLATGLTGYGLGATMGGAGMSRAGAALADMATSATWKDGVKAALAKKAAGQALSPVETKLVKEAAGLAGAMAASYAQNVGTGLSDIYGELRDAGVGPNDTEARLKALAGSIPYAALETLPEYLLAERVLNPAKFVRSMAGLSLGRKAVEVGKRVAVGATVGGLAEGGTEAGQEGILIGANENVDWDSPQGINRLVNSFAAGFGIGGPIGGMANLRSGKPVNIANPGDTTDPVAPGPPGAPPGPPRPGAPEDQAYPDLGPPLPPYGLQQEMDLGQVPPPVGPPLPGAEDQQQYPFMGPQLQGPQQGEMSLPVEPYQPDLFGVPRAAPLQTTDNMLPGAVPPVVNPAQGQLQFAPPAPAGIGFTDRMPPTAFGEQLQAAQQAATADQAYAARGAEQATAAARLRELGLSRMAGAQELARVPAPIDEALAGMPMQDIPVRTPQQLRLFKPRETPRPTGTERMKRGMAPLSTAGELIPPPVQQPLFTPQQLEFPLRIRKGKADTKAPKASLKRGLKAQAGVVEVTKVVPIPAPTLPTKAPPVKTEPAKGKAALTAKPKEATHAVQKRGAETLHARKAPADRGAVGQELPVAGKAAGTLKLRRKETPSAAPAAGKEKIVRKKVAEIPEAKIGASVEAKLKEPPVPKTEAAAVVSPAVAVQPKESIPSEKAESTVVEQIEEDIDEAPTDRKAWTHQVVSTIKDVKTSKKATVKERKQYVLNLAWLLGNLYEKDPAAKKPIAMMLDSMDLTDPLFREALTEMAKMYGVLDMGMHGKRGVINPLFEYITRSNMFDALAKVAQYKHLPPGHEAPTILPSPEKAARVVERKAVPPKKVEAPQPVRTFPMAMKLANAIMQINNNTTPLTKTAFKNTVDHLAELWQQVVAEGTQDFTMPNGEPLSTYFTNGKPNATQVDKQMRVGVPVDKAARLKLIKEKAAAAAKKTDYVAPMTLDDWNTASRDKGGRWSLAGEPITNPMPHGRTRMLVRQFVSRLYAKPLVHVYRNQADFKAQNPEAYARAVAEYARDDFDTANAVGYSFGREIAIFTDRVVTPQQLRFVLAHESLGHYGFRALMPEAELHAALNLIYNQSPHIKGVADIYMQTLGMSKAEAVEEYLADHAAVLENNVLQRFWNAIKNFFKPANFQDDMARYLISQSRAYVRHGKTDGRFFNFREIAQKWLDYETIQQPLKTGRMFTEALEYGEANRLAPDAARHIRYDDKMSEVKAMLSKKGINVGDGIRKLLANLKTMNYSARENLGFRKLYDVLLDTVHTASFLRAKYNNMMSTVLQPAISVLGHEFTGGGERATEAQIATAGNMLKATALKRSLELSDNKLRKMGGLYDLVDGEAVRNADAIAQMKALGRISLKQFQDGFEYTTYTASPITDADKVQIEKDRAKALEGKTAPKDLKDINAEYDELKNGDTYMRPKVVTFPAMPNLTKDSLEYKMYLEVRETVDEAALDLLEANFAAVKGERDSILRAVSRFLGRDLTAADETAVENLKTQYMTLRNEDRIVMDDGEIRFKQDSLDKANAFMAKFNEVMLAHETDKDVQLKKFLNDKEYDDISKDIATLRKGSHISRDTNRKFKMQQSVQNIAMFEMGRDDAHMFAKRTIAGGYVPFGREGAWQVRVNAVDPKTGQVYKVHELYRQSLVYMQMDDKAESVVSANAINRIFEGGNKEGTFRLKVLDDDNQWRVKVVELHAQAESAKEDAPAGRETNLNELITTLSQLSIDLRPDERERLVTRLTQQNHRARTRLRRTGAPGEDPNVVKYVSQHLEATASTVARKQNRHKLDRLFDDDDGESQRLWKGDQVRYDSLKKAWEDAQKNPALSDEQKKAHKMAFIDYHYTYKVKDSPTYGNKYINDGNKLLAFLDAQKDVEFTDFGSGATMSKARQWMTFAMLGVSPATALLNYISLGTNVVPSLAGYNENNGFGGGFGWAKSSTEVTRALNQTKSDKQSYVKYWKALLDDESDKLLTEAGFTRTEAEFMHRQVGGGTMQAAQTNALLGAMRSQLKSGFQQEAAKKWMFLFNYSEQTARRSTGLAAFRMALDREWAAREIAKIPQNSEARIEAETAAFQAAEKFAVEMIDNTLGQYAMFNRPALFRGGFGQFVFMYKMFPINAIQMLKNLPRKEQLLALGILMMFSGLKGLPFAEDLLDAIDTIAQALGFGPGKLWHGSAEKTLADFLDWIAPGLTPYMLRGVLNHVVPANISDRTSLGNIVPGTGIALAGADVGRELIEIGGPFASFVQGGLKLASNTAKTALEPSEAGVISTLRDQPVTMLRALGDIAAYTNAGAIVNQRGYVVSRDLHMGTFFARAAGFYPSAGVRENDVVRIGRRIGDYRKDIAAHYYSRYVSASLGDDQDAVNNVLDDVAEWNDAARGTELELVNFRKSARRALKEANRTTTERYLRTIPKNTRADVQHVKDMLMPEGEQEAATAD